MLWGHHKNRVKKLLNLKSLDQKIHEAELMIARYQKSCFVEARDKSQYESDLIAIKLLISKNR